MARMTSVGGSFAQSPTRSESQRNRRARAASVGENSCPPSFVPTRTVWRCNASTRRQRRNPERDGEIGVIRRLFARVVLKQFIEKRAAALSTVAPLAAARVGDDEVELDEVGEKDSTSPAARRGSGVPRTTRKTPDCRSDRVLDRPHLVDAYYACGYPSPRRLRWRSLPPRSSVVSRTPRRRPSIPKSPPARPLHFVARASTARTRRTAASEVNVHAFRQPPSRRTANRTRVETVPPPSQVCQLRFQILP